MSKRTNASNPKTIRKQITLTPTAAKLGKELAARTTRGNLSLLLDGLIVNESERLGLSKKAA